MLEAAREAMSFIQGQSRKALDSNRMLVLSLVKCIEIIGEAASRVSPETQAKHTGIPWVDIVGMRNRLIHAYFEIDLDRVWDTVTDDLPPLVSELEKASASEEGREAV
jgi:uncharacterized protein with HEPN domain